MSLRPEICGFELSKMGSLFGSRDEELERLVAERIGEIADDMEDSDEDDDEALAEVAEYRKVAAQVLHDAIHKGIPFEGLETEGEAHVDVASFLAVHGQTPLPMTSSSGWSVQAFDHLSRVAKDKLDANARRLLEYFRAGRPIFGRVIDTGWSYYGYLTRDEVDALRSALVGIKGELPELERDKRFGQFFGELVGWLDQISERRLDLWFYTT